MNWKRCLWLRDEYIGLFEGKNLVVFTVEAWGNDKDYLSELLGLSVRTPADRDHSSLIIWSGALEFDAVICKTRCIHRRTKSNQNDPCRRLRSPMVQEPISDCQALSKT